MSNQNGNEIMEKPILKELNIDSTDNRIWIQIDNVGIAFTKENFIGIIENTDTFQLAKALRK